MDYREAMQLLRGAGLFAPALIREGDRFYVYSRMEQISSGASIEEALDAGGFLGPNVARPALFVAADYNVVEGSKGVCVARSKTMAARIANALNEYIPGLRGF
jgi:hypothetical protein